MNVQTTASDGTVLQCRLRPAVGTPRGTVLLLHPHPAFGGHMDVWLLPTIAARLAEDGWASLRLNFRGVEGSTGTQTGGVSEHLDAQAGHQLLVDTVPDVPRAVVGWSFGAMVGLRLGRRVDAFVGIGTPTRHLAEVPLAGPLVPDELPRHRTVVVGEHDQFFPPDSVDVLSPDVVVQVPDADHFMFDLDHAVAQLVADALRPALAPPDRDRSTTS